MESSLLNSESDELIKQSEIALASARNIFSQINLTDKVFLEPIFEKSADRAKDSNECSVCMESYGNKTISLLSW
jgi:hypothetical protein